MDESRTCLGVRVRVKDIPDTVSMDESPCLGVRVRVRVEDIPDK